jgi:KR domain
MTQDAALPKQSAARLRTVLAPRGSGTCNLLAAAAAAPLGGVALFSSIAALLGNAGQSNYAAANALLDAGASAAHAQVCRYANARVLFNGKCRQVAGLTEKPLACRTPLERMLYASCTTIRISAFTLGEWVAVLDRSCRGSHQAPMLLPCTTCLETNASTPLTYQPLNATSSSESTLPAGFVAEHSSGGIHIASCSRCVAPNGTTMHTESTIKILTLLACPCTARHEHGEPLLCWQLKP